MSKRFGAKVISITLTALLLIATALPAAAAPKDKSDDGSTDSGWTVIKKGNGSWD